MPGQRSPERDRGDHARMESKADEALSPKEIAPLLGVSVRTAQEIMASGELGFRAGKKLLRATRAQVEAYKRRNARNFRPEPEPAISILPSIQARTPATPTTPASITR